MRTSCGLEKVRGIQAAHALNWNLAAVATAVDVVSKAGRRCRGGCFQSGSPAVFKAVHPLRRGAAATAALLFPRPILFEHEPFRLRWRAAVRSRAVV